MQQIQAELATGNRSRLTGLMADQRLDWLVLSAPETVTYATGFVEVIETGPSSFAGGPSMTFVGRNGECALVAPTRLRDIAGVQIEPYVGFHWAEYVEIGNEYRSAIVRATETLRIGGRIGYEARSCPARLTQMLPGSWEAMDRELDLVRCIKSAGEIELLTRSAHTAACGQQAALVSSRPGVSELAVFAAIRNAMEEFAGERLAVAGDYLSGAERTAQASGWPNTRVIQTGDPIVCDLAPRVSGYWGDSCASFVVGEPSALFKKLFKASSEALATALDIMRPGLRVSELDGRMREIVGRHGFMFPHHSGHSIGTAVHEWPRVVPFEQTVLEKDMVLMMEPAAYDPAGGGVRLEFMLHVEADGCRILAPFEHRMQVGA